MKTNSIKRHIAIILIIFILFYSVTGLIILESNTSKAFVGFSNDVAGMDDNKYPGYKSLIQGLQSRYPNWRFTLYYTGIDWTEAVISQCQGHGGSPKSLFQLLTTGAFARTGDWHCPVCGNRAYDNGSWRCASEAAVAYVLDPRNGLTADNVFQFQNISNDLTITHSQVQTMVSGTFLNDTALIQAILNAATAKDINPLFIAARILQEQGSNGSALSRGQGWNGEFVGFYNYFNIGATGNTQNDVIRNGLSTAASRGWNTPEKSIVGGITFLADNYVSEGQNTPYFQKFNVVKRSNLYNNQYMQNIQAGLTEGFRLRDAYNAIGRLNGNYTFVIPVYENMPRTVSPRPNASTVFVAKEFDRATINANGGLTLRASPNGTALRSIPNGANVIILERATTQVNGSHWDKVIAYSGSVGYTGYMARARANGDPYLVTHTFGKDTVNGSVTAPPPIGPNNAFKVETIGEVSNLVMEPNTTLSEIRNAGYNITSIIQNGVDVSQRELLATGTVITLADETTLTIIKMGDVTGTGSVTSADFIRISNTIMGRAQLNEFQRRAADVNGDGQITSADFIRISNFIMSRANISI